MESAPTRRWCICEQELLDPFLLPDYFGSDNPDDFMAGFPWHPHRGMETVTYMLDGKVEHSDSMGNSGMIAPRYQGIPSACVPVAELENGTRGKSCTGASGVTFILVSGKPIRESIAWRGPIVMNTEEELAAAFRELREGTFIR